MRKIILSAVATIAMSSFAVAGGDIVPVAPIVEKTPGNFYVGVGYACLDARQTDAPSINPTVNDVFDAVMLKAGYKFNEYIAAEARVTLGFEETVVSDMVLNHDSSMSTWGIYAKPMYPVTDSVDVYGLLGYASSEYDLSIASVDDSDGFSWGLGVEYAFTNQISAFVDYTSLYQNSNTPSDDYIQSFSLGLGYTF